MIETFIIKPNEDTCIDSSRPYKNLSNLIVSWIGTKNYLTEYRYLIRFNYGCLPKASEILSCQLMLYVDCAESSTVNSVITPYIIASDWNWKKVTWSTQPDIYPELHGERLAVSSPGWYQWNITNLFDKWYSGGLCNLGLLLKDDGKSPNAVKRIISSRNCKARLIKYRPYALIKYRRPSYSKNIVVSGRSFTERTITVATENDYRHTAGFDTSQQSNATFFIKNIGSFSAEAYIEVSPNNLDLVNAGPPYNIAPGMTIALVPRFFSRYTHIAYKSGEPQNSTLLEITMQAQV